SSRQLLYDSIAKHGFLQNSRTSLYSTAPSLEINARIKSENFYQMLKELRNAGSLKSEAINVYDLTSDNIMTLITKNRREERIKRRSSTLLNPSLSPKDHSARERALEESEDQMDMAEHQLWQLQDRVTWASLTIYVTGPDTGKNIVVPRFKDAFTSLLNGTLEVIYNLILVSPFLIILVIIFIKRKRLWDIFMTQHKSEKNREDYDD
ncbi:MAG TPA: DUF4349 domain-containing protein, partial [Spirochaetota bacterium]|nr:DUF4349 domain-containing protein [Spirochaetota bacterium]